MTSSTLRRVLVAPARTEAGALSASAVLEVVGIALSLAKPWPLALAVDWAMSDGTRPAALQSVSPEMLLVGCGAAVVALSALSSVTTAAATRSAESAAERLGARLRAQTFAGAMSAPLQWHQHVRSGELVSRITADVGRLLDTVVALAVTAVPAAITLVGVVILLVILDPTLAAVALAVIPALAVLSVRQRRRVRATQVAARAASGRLTGTTTDLVRNVPAVQAFGAGATAQQSFERRNGAVLSSAVHALRVETRWSPLCDVVLALGSGVVLVMGGLQVRNGTQSVGHLLVLMAYLRELYAPVRGLSRLSVLLAKATASADRVAEVLDQPHSAVAPTREATAPSPGAQPGPSGIDEIAFHGVTFGYRPGQPVVRDLDLRIRRGETVCLLGPSGVGKSTLLLLMLRLFDVDSGRITVNGTDLRDVDVARLRQRIAYVPQDPWLLDATLAANVAFGSPGVTRDDIVAACRLALVDEFAELMPRAYDTPLGEGGARLSGGQRRRVAIARAAVSPAELVLLDEPTASLDDLSARGVIRAITRATRDRTTVIVTHDPRLAEIADRTIVLRPPSPSGVAESSGERTPHGERTAYPMRFAHTPTDRPIPTTTRRR